MDDLDVPPARGPAHPAPPASDPWRRAQGSARRLADRLGGDVELAVVLGSGFAGVVDDWAEASAPMGELGFPTPTVPGHEGTVLSGAVDGHRVLFLCGRVHLYEGHSPAAVVHGVRTVAALGCPRLVLTNAAGSLRPDLAVGDLVAISDHLNLSGANPLTGAHDLPHPRFVDASEVYTLSAALAAAAGLTSGVYAALPGPTFETPAEIRMLATLGADLVGMSTALEALAAHALGVRVAGMSLVTNAAAGLGAELSHDEVTEVGRQRGAAVADTLLSGAAALLGEPAGTPWRPPTAPTPEEAP